MSWRPWPRSMLGQVMLWVALALLIAQGVSAVLLVRAQEQRREEILLNAAAFRLIAMPMPREFRRERGVLPRENEGSGPMDGHRMPRSFRIEHSARFTAIAGDTRYQQREERMKEILSNQGVPAHAVRVVTRKLGNDPYAVNLLNAMRARSRLRQSLLDGSGEMLVVGLQADQASKWQIARIPMPPPQPRAMTGIIGQTILIYIMLIGGLALLLRRTTRPLQALTRRVSQFAQTPEIHGQIEPAGPDDISRLIEAHNRMEGRIAGLLDEKDVMLGAIGHDLKTPLAALRVRVESVEDEAERARMAATIEDIVRTLDDILSLARVGRSSDPLEMTELSSLIASVVEEYEDMGEPVTLGATSRVALPLRATWLRRAIRNLIGNALRYGKQARVSLQRDGEGIAVRVEDDGPGIPTDEIFAMMEPFVRGDPSRNKGTGGAGLGLALARAIAEQHGGRLVLSNRHTANGAIAGLTAEIRLPIN